MDDSFIVLEQEYCPPIDPATFYAIASDYDNLSNSTSNRELRATLDSLKESALAEEHTGFNSSGSSGLQHDTSSYDSSERARSWQGDALSAATGDTDVSAVPQASSSVDLVNNVRNGDLDWEQVEAEVEALPPARKLSKLEKMFPNAKEFDINYTLKKVGNNFKRAMEELLNQALLEEEDLNGKEANIKRGIEAFTEPANATHRHRGRKRNKQILRRTSSTPAPIVPQYLRRAPSPISSTINTRSSSTHFVASPSSTAAALTTTRANALAQQQAAYRKSKSEHLLGAAASHYSSMARDTQIALRHQEAISAYEHVARQSRPGQLDLHGVVVEDAVRIAEEEVDGWWEREGREYARRGKVMGSGLKIITGVGRHSEGGKGKIGPAVRKMLKSHGWKIEDEEGVIEVVGRVRR